MTCCGGGLLVMVLWGLLLVAIVVGAIVLAGALFDREAKRAHPRSDTPTGSRPIEILEERYARGEIDLQEFEERRRTLDALTADGD